MVRNTFAVLALLAVGANAQAGMVVSLERMVNPGSTAAPYNGFASTAFATDTGMNAGAPASTWVSYALGVIPSGGEKVTTFDITLSMPVSGTSGFSQRWTLDADDPGLPAVPTPSSPSVTTGDSHLIVGGSIQFVAPTENSGPPGPPIASNTATRSYGVGSSMSGAWGFTPTEQATQQDGVPVRFAYIVIPRGVVPNIQITANVAASQTAAGYLFNQNQFLPLFPNEIPEPATFTLVGLVLAGAGCFIRRR